MLDIRPFYEADSGTWSYLLADCASKVAAIIDPVWVFDPVSGMADTAFIDDVLEASRRESWRIEWVLETHAHADHLTAADYLRRRTGAKIKFLSLEPLLGPLHKLNLQSINWAIVGGESGPGARPLDPAWVIDIRNQCVRAKVPFFFKQWGGVQKKKAGRMLEGRTWDEMPISLNLAKA